MTTHTKQAMVLLDSEVRQLREWIAANSKMPERDDLIFLLSFHAGLRVSEIVKIDLDAMLSVGGTISNQIIVDNKVGKGGYAREVPMTPYIIDALIRFRRRYPDATYPAIGIYKKGRRMTVNGLTGYMFRVMRNIGFSNASSHSGRRTYITNLARRINKFGGSLRDVQLMAGHAQLNTTQRYVDANPAVFAAAASLAA